MSSPRIREASSSDDLSSICVIGGTGAQGRGLAVRFAAAGHHVLVGSRSTEKATAAAAAIRALLPSDASGRVTGHTNAGAAAAADVVVIATPWDDAVDSVSWLAPHVAGKVVISCVNPLGFDKRGPFGLEVDAGSAAEHIAGQLPDARVAGAFHHVAASRLAEAAADLSDEDILVAADDPGAASVAAELCRTVTGRAGVDAGPLRMCRQLEPWTAVLISVNKGYRTHSGISLCNVDTSRQPGRLQSAGA